MEEAKESLHPEGIIPGALYTPKNVEHAWGSRWASFTQNVVCVNQLYDYDDQFPGSGTDTGTLISVGKPELEGRVVLTCAHVVLRDFGRFHDKNNNIEELFSPENESDQVISIHSQKLRHFKWINAKYCSREGWFKIGKDNLILSVKAECRRGEFGDDIPITNIYLLTGNDEGTNCYDVAICILKEPVKFEGKIVPGIELDKLNAFTEMERVSAVSPYHHIHLEGPLGEAFPVDQRPVVIGYGLTGLRDWHITRRLSSVFSAEQERSLLGFGIKKAMILNGLDLSDQGVLQNMKGCSCTGFPCEMAEFSLLQIEEKLRTQSCEAYINQAADYLLKAKGSVLNANGRITRAAKILSEKAGQFLEMAKAEKNEIECIIARGEEYFEQFSVTKSFYSKPLAGGGFSGSLMVSKRDDGNYDAIGICSGPLFTSEIKSFIKNVAQYHRDC
ncbi:MAG: hypothetical protein LBD60_04580 [Puniceicoccales bacterium]|nr:hypothetical protein [Puniceicoccales bacterium]